MRHVNVMEFSSESIHWDAVYEYFYGYTHIDVKEIPEVYQDYVIPMKDVLMKEGIFRIKYGCAEVVEKDQDRIMMEDGISFDGKMIAKAYEETSEIILYVISVVNIDELLNAHPDMMDSFFLEYWAISVLNASREHFYKLFEETIIEKNQKLTSVWSPGQSKFELYNQKALFTLLKPEEIGVILDKHMRMIPLKTVSGTIGIVSQDCNIELISCDYCEHAKTCPGYKGKKYANITMEDRRI